MPQVEGRSMQYSRWALVRLRLGPSPRKIPVGPGEHAKKVRTSTMGKRKVKSNNSNGQSHSNYSVASADQNRQTKSQTKGLLNQRLHLLTKIGKQKVKPNNSNGGSHSNYSVASAD
jgi:hypothetical protein